MATGANPNSTTGETSYRAPCWMLCSAIYTLHGRKQVISMQSRPRQAWRVRSAATDEHSIHRSSFRSAPGRLSFSCNAPQIILWAVFFYRSVVLWLKTVPFFSAALQVLDMIYGQDPRFILMGKG